MLTPQEVSERAFPKASFGGYNMGQVDEFLDLLTADYTALYNENAVLKNKMKVLVEKVEEYRSTEEAMRKALMTAQRMADELVQDAERKKAEIMAEAEEEIRSRTETVRKEIEAEQFRLSAAQSATAAYVAKVRALHEQELAHLDQLHELAPDAVPSQETEEDRTVSEIDDNVHRLLAQAMADATAENLKAKAAAEPQDLADTSEYPVVEEQAEEPQAEEQPQEAETEPEPEPVSGSARRLNFDNLQFGRDYEID